MLQQIHDKAKGWVAYLIIFMISVPFALWGIQEYLGGGDKRVVATVNGDDITLQMAQNELLQQKQQLSQMFGGKLPNGFTDESLKTAAIENLVNRTLLRQEAEKHGYRASSKEILQVLTTFPAFQKDGKFDPAQYELVIKAQGRTKKSLEDSLRNDLSQEQFTNAILQSAFVPNSEAGLYQSLNTQQRDVEMFTLKLDDYKGQVQISDEAIKKFYDSKPASLMTEEKVQLSWVELNQDDIAATIDVSGDVLQTYFDENSDKYVEPEKYKASRILVRIKPEQNEEQAKQKAQGLYDAISTGEKTFESIAQSDNDDKIAAEKSGDLGFLPRGEMSEDFEKVVFSLNPGEVSEPVKTGLGYEIIKLVEIKPGSQQTFEQAKAQVESDYRTEKAEIQFVDASDKLQTLAYENDSSLEPAANEIGADIKTSDWISHSSGTGIGSHAQVLAAAFSNAVLKEGRNSELLELTPTHVAVVRLYKHEKPVLKPFDSVKEDIRNQLVEKEARKLVAEKGKAVLARLKEAKNWSVLQELGSSAENIQKLTGLTRTDNKPTPLLSREIFRLSAPENNQATYAGIDSPNGDYILLALTKVQNGKTEVDATMANTFSSYIGGRERAAAMKALREQADVELFPQNFR
jgi:peptidyl-prolyl cis-trans isomerase D